MQSSKASKLESLKYLANIFAEIYNWESGR
jgi:hypothetical protein